MRLHGGGGSVVAYARRTLGGQAIGTEFCHRSCRGSHSLATRAHGIAMILSPPRGCLMPRLRPPAPLPHAALAAVDLPVVVERAEVDDEPAPRAGNPYEHLDIIHARTETAAHESCPARAPSGTFARSASTRDTKAQGSTPGPSSISPSTDRVRDVASRGHFSDNTAMCRVLRFSAIVHTLLPKTLRGLAQTPWWAQCMPVLPGTTLCASARTTFGWLSPRAWLSTYG